ncbi:hypothetical protein M9Y10_018746 [Tritrichomonas musculus]|uniref:Uncharacterized protein n=1 Tax=Tritrichomonas musculus TaxID=1915356 RepID=A0ABR2HMN1_9EUKA
MSDAIYFDESCIFDQFLINPEDIETSETEINETIKRCSSEQAQVNSNYLDDYMNFEFIPPIQYSNENNEQPQSNENEMSNQPSVAWLDNNDNDNNQKRNSSGSRLRRPKTILSLSKEQKCFKDGYYKIFTSRKKFKKEYVVKIHNDILANILGFQKIQRNESRSIDTYFQNYAPYKDQIFQVLRSKKEIIIKKILINFD